MLVRTLRAHGNAYGPVFEPDPAQDGRMRRRGGEVYPKRPGDAYRHPDPQQLIADEILEAAGPLDLDGSGAAGGSMPGPRSRRKRAPKS